MTNKLKVLELFAGTRSIGRAFEERGHEVLSVDWDERFKDIDLQKDVLELYAEEVLEKLGKPDVIWASPDCTTYSIAAISHHRRREDSGNLAGVSNYAKTCDRVNLHVHNLVMMLTPPHLVHRESKGRHEKDGLHARPQPPHADLLPVRRYAHEANGHLDESSRSEIQASMPQRRLLPCLSSPRSKDRDSRLKGIGRAKPHTARALRSHRGYMRGGAL